MIPGIILLAVTIGIYTMYPKLLNPYTRIMRHYAFALFLAFSSPWPQQVFRIDAKDQREWCKFAGFFQQYFFLAFFTFMTAMSLETWKQLRGSPSNSRRYRNLIIFGYGFPTTVVAITLIAEVTLQECSNYKPNFGETRMQCWFDDTQAEFLWFLLPIIILLTINAGLFANVIFILVQMDKQKKNLKLKTNQAKEARERGILYLKMFVGMGFLWILEILQKLTAEEKEKKYWIIADIIQLMQPFYVFVIFCCKRNVLNVIQGKDDPRKTSKATRSKGKTTKSTQIEMTAIRKETSASSVSHAITSESPSLLKNP